MTRPDPAVVNGRNNHFEAWALDERLSGLGRITSDDVALPPEWHGSQLFMYLHLYTKRVRVW